MKTFISYFLACVIIALAIVIIPAERLFDEITNTEKIVESLREGKLHDHLLDLFSKTALKQEALDPLAGSPLALNDQEIRAILNQTFPEDWFTNQIRQAHRAVIAQLDHDAIHSFVGFVWTDKKNLLVENFISAFRNKLEALPACGQNDLFKMGVAFSKRKTISQLDLKTIPPCKPPELVQKEILRTVRSGLEKAVQTLPDSLDLLNINKSGGNMTFKSTFDEARKSRRIEKTFSVAGYGVLLGALVIIVLINLSDRKKLYFRTGVPFVGSGFLLCCFALPVLWFINTFSASNIRTGAVNAPGLNEELNGLFLSLARSFSYNYCWNLVYFGAALFIIGIVFIALSRFVKNEPTAAV